MVAWTSPHSLGAAPLCGATILSRHAARNGDSDASQALRLDAVSCGAEICRVVAGLHCLRGKLGFPCAGRRALSADGAFPPGPRLPLCADRDSRIGARGHCRVVPRPLRIRDNRQASAGILRQVRRVRGAAAIGRDGFRPAHADHLRPCSPAADQGGDHPFGRAQRQHLGLHCLRDRGARRALLFPRLAPKDLWRADPGIYRETAGHDCRTLERLPLFCFIFW